MNIWQAMVLGIVQGLTEFLPVSSSGHLVLLQQWFGISEGSMFFTVMLHLGTLAAVLAVFYRDVLELIRRPFSEDGKCIIIATLITGVIYIALDDLVDSSFDGRYLWLGFLFTAALLWWVSRIEESGEDVTPRRSVVMGLMQGIALFPGISRSGSTIAGGLISGAGREQAARLSFLMSVPAILAGAVKEVGEITLTDVPWAAVIVGTVFAALSGYLAIRFMLRIIQEKKLYWFSVYLAAAAALAFFTIS